MAGALSRPIWWWGGKNQPIDYCTCEAVFVVLLKCSKWGRISDGNVNCEKIMTHTHNWFKAETTLAVDLILRFFLDWAVRTLVFVEHNAEPRTVERMLSLLELIPRGIPYVVNRMLNWITRFHGSDIFMYTSQESLNIFSFDASPKLKTTSFWIVTLGTLLCSLWTCETIASATRA